MKNTLFLFLAIISSIGKGATSPGKDEVAKSNSNTVVRVLIERDAKATRVKSVLSSLFLKQDGQNAWKNFPKEIALSMRQTKYKHQVAINNFDPEDRAFLVRGGPHPTDKVQYRTDFFRGALKVTPTQGGFSVTNILPLDDYLAGTLAAEMNGLWEMEALKAQAVASRTYTLYMVKHPKHALYDLDSSTQDQVYQGAERESKRVSEALRETAGLYLSVKDSEPIKSYYHSRCGGITETAGAVWNYKNHAFDKRVTCPYCQKFPYNWTTVVTAAELFKSLHLPFQTISTLSNLSAEKTPAGRVSTLRFALNGTEKKVTSDELRSLLGYSRIKSANFDWKIDGDEIQFNGVGSGHGVGMCQWGARYLAKQGKNFRQILAHYYPGIELKKLQN